MAGGRGASRREDQVTLPEAKVSAGGETASVRLTEAAGMVMTPEARSQPPPAIARTEIRREHLGACVILDEKAHRHTEMGLPRLERFKPPPAWQWS